MTRPIKFVETEWGRVAYSKVGSGRPLLFDTGWVSHLESMWGHGGYRGLVERLAESHEVVCFDAPGTGLSDRNRRTTSLDDEVVVLEAVLQAVGAGQHRPASMFCSSIAASTAIRHAAHHPEAVHRLVLFGATLKGADLGSDSARGALLRLVREHWGLGSRMLSDIFVPDLDADERHWFDEWQRLCTDGATAASRLEMFYESDVSADAALVTAPTLVVHRSGDSAVGPELGARTAAAIEDATLAMLDGSSHLCFLGDSAGVAELVLSFLEAETEHSLPRGPFGEFTAREHDVAQLTVEGLSNAAIGERLGISPRTVETHLVHIRSKLGVGTRAEIAAWMARRAEFR
ncbi:MAG: alpha/beta fold hydrolase [Acidimicrobiia bacterium]|nr:alpha/beta fold hydrolase [Acidimicrobiia bacterium]